MDIMQNIYLFLILYQFLKILNHLVVIVKIMEKSFLNYICKVFDYAILYLCGNCFETSDMQFGFKKHHSTVLFSLIYHELINNYLSHGSNVYNYLLDASKAFARIHYGKLFYIYFN